MKLLKKLKNIGKKEETGNTGTSEQGNPVEATENKSFEEGLVSTKDIIAPSAIEIDFNHVRIDNKYYRTLFVAGYPRFVGINWLSPLINFDASLNVSMYVYPTDGKEILDDLRRKITEMEAEISTDIQRGRIVNPATQAKLEDALALQADLVKGEERFFQFGLYITISAESVEDLDRINKNLEAALGALLIISKKATLQMEEGFMTTLPICSDSLNIARNMDTTSLATTFPFVSSDLSDNKGIMYGINQHNGSLVIFDRFGMPNYNSVVFATAGAGKSYMIKLEALRSLMFDTDIIVIDPENEYRNLCDAAGGQYIAFGYGENSKINPFDLSMTVEEEGENALNSKILSLHKLFKIMIGEMTPMEESILDRAIMDAYKMKGVTPDPETQNREPPLIEDLYKSLIGAESKEAQSLAARIEKYIRGSFAGIFNQKTTVDLKNRFVVFGIKNLEESLRPIAMHIILDYIWTTVKKELKRRIMIVDEAWYLMQYPDSAAFLRGVVKRGRKYYLGVTTITQDVDDFLETPYGKEIVTNSSIQILLKQHSAAIDKIGEVFYLSEGEKQLLLTADKGEGIFFAGQNHVAIKVIASEDEHQLITSNPEDILRMKNEGKVNSLENSKKVTTVEAIPINPENIDLEQEDEIEHSQNSQQPIDSEKIDEPEVKVIPEEVGREDTEENITKDDTIIEPKEQKGVTENNKSVTTEENVKREIQSNTGGSKSLYRAEVVGSEDENEELLQRRIDEMEKAEEEKIKDFRQQESVDVVEDKNETKEIQETFEPPKVIKFGEGSGGGSKPIFINNTEKKVPQPSQLSSKPKPVFEDEKKKDNIKEDEQSDYDKLFGDGIV
ncbi:MAG: VirB4-like conjugal transfer ATPase, CD1110 family [Patescibacteria group bacterium]|jgi:conjugal transfer ATP-binding protein TraC